MYLKKLTLAGFKSFAKKTELEFSHPITAIVGPNGSGKSNVTEALRFVLGEQSFKSMRGKRGEDLIWGGSQATARAGRGSVEMVFDNSNRLFNIDYDEVAIERVVHRDGVNEYRVNGSQVRLRDVMELLAGANIGSSGHHIVSQGESDRILTSSPRERREMLEDALGLKIYQYKKQESERKLEKTRENIAQVQSLRKEIQPHLKFLERQVGKLAKAEELRTSLGESLSEYLKREELYISNEESDIEKNKDGPRRKYNSLEAKLEEAKEKLSKSEEGAGRSKEIASLAQELSQVRKKRDETTRKLGRIEGQIAFEKKTSGDGQGEEEGKVRLSSLFSVVEKIKEQLLEARREEDPKKVRSLFESAFDLLQNFIAGAVEKVKKERKESNLEDLEGEGEALDRELSKLVAKEDGLSKKYEMLKREVEESKEENREAEREVFRISTQQAQLRTHLQELRAKEARVRLLREEFKRDIAEALPLVGGAVREYQNIEIKDKEGRSVSEKDMVAEPRDRQEERKRELERMKIRLEEMRGGQSDEILKEHKEVRERDIFLSGEIEDLEHSATSLEQLISELAEKLDILFTQGLGKINKEFQHFFSLMFDGGSAALSVVAQPSRHRVRDEEEEGEPEEGIDIQVSLPRKRIKGLVMLSGGERSLTSIALIFAMSQVNPPPFLVLDETDAALDEANSKRYGDMIESLAKKSQLILVTHNRETMSRAGVLYGVTMGSDGISRLLSVKFEEAVAVAK